MFSLVDSLFDESNIMRMYKFVSTVAGSFPLGGNVRSFVDLPHCDLCRSKGAARSTRAIPKFSVLNLFLENAQIFAILHKLFVGLAHKCASSYKCKKITDRFSPNGHVFR